MQARRVKADRHAFTSVAVSLPLYLYVLLSFCLPAASHNRMAKAAKQKQKERNVYTGVGGRGRPSQ